MANYFHENVKTDKDIPVRFFSYDMSNLFVPSHWHNSMEIIYILSGTMVITTNDKRYNLSENEYMIINSGEIHSTRTGVGTHTQLLQIPYQFLKQNIPNYDKLSFYTTPTVSFDATTPVDPLLTIFNQMQNCYEMKSSGYMLRFNSLLYELLYLLVNQYSVSIDNSVNTKSAQIKQRLVTIMDYIKVHYMDPISLVDVSNLVSLNPEYFCRFFKRHTGTTFLEYVNEIRLSHIEKDLLLTADSITKLLEKHGFTNYKLFMKMFREKYGTTPIQYKKLVAANLTSPKYPLPDIYKLVQML